MKIKKRHLILASLVLALSGAVYLNWQLSGENSLTVANPKELGSALYVNSENESSKDEMAVNATENKNSSLTDEQIEYFATSRTDRQKVQDEAITLAKQVLELTENSEEAHEEASEQLSSLENIFISQNRVEMTLKAKGFSDCLCTLSDTSCTVIVPKNEMNDNSTLIIKDCISEVSDLPFENISIIEI